MNCFNFNNKQSLLLCDGYVVDDREESEFKKLHNLECVCLIKTTEI